MDVKFNFIHFIFFGFTLPKITKLLGIELPKIYSLISDSAHTFNIKYSVAMAIINPYINFKAYIYIL